MSSRPFVKATNGLVHITDTNLDHDRLAELVDEYRAAEKAADEDYDQRRLNHHDHVTRPAAESAADDVRDEAGLQLDWEAALRFSDDVARAAALARQQQAATSRNPLLKGA